VFKYALKSIARKLDQIRCKKEDSKCEYVSIELFIEWYCSAVYWIWLRFLIAYNTPNFAQFVYAMLVHFGTESYKTTFCASKFYYSSTSKLVYKCSYSERWLVKCLFKERNLDDSTIDEWNIRTSMDAVIRYFAAYLSGVLMIVYLAVVGRGGFESHLYQGDNGDNYDGTTFEQVFEYTAITFLCEMVYYAITFVVNLYCNNFNALYPFINYVNSMSGSHKAVVCLLYVSVFSLLRFT